MPDIKKAGHSTKHLLVNKANTTMLVAVAATIFVVVFCAFAVRALISQSLYHNKVISEKKTALSVLQNNKKAADELKVTYESFATESINVLSGDPEGDGPLDGDNAKVVLDALPSEYDYPALSSSVEKILIDGGYQIQSIGGSEDINQQTPVGEEVVVTGRTAEAVEIPYPFSIETSPDSALKLLETIESSIRPFYVDSLRLTGQGDNLSISVGLKTFYLPASGLEVTTKVVR